MIKYLKILLGIIVVVCAVGSDLSNIQAGEHRHHKAHVHGVAHMNVAVEENELYIELISPAANIVGFEHHPRSEAQKAAVEKAIETLKAGEALFILPSGAEGRLAKTKVYTDIAGDSDHESEEAHTHEHNEISKKHEEDKHHHQEDHESDKHETHSEFRAEYHFLCKKPEKLAYIDVMLFNVFSGIEHIEVQLLTVNKKTALELTAKKTKIIF